MPGGIRARRCLGSMGTVRGGGAPCAVAGGWAFDPFGFADDPAAAEDLKVKEIKNGRVAMVAWAGFFAQVRRQPRCVHQNGERTSNPSSTSRMAVREGRVPCRWQAKPASFWCAPLRHAALRSCLVLCKNRASQGVTWRRRTSEPRCQRASCSLAPHHVAAERLCLRPATEVSSHLSVSVLLAFAAWPLW